MNTIQNDTIIRVEEDELVDYVFRAATCEKHGDYESCQIESKSNGEHRPLGKPSRCPECLKIEEQQREIRRAEHARIEAGRMAIEQLNARIEHCAIPPRFGDATLDNYIATNAGQRYALAKAKRYAANFETVLKTGQGLTLLGNIGNGKTHLSVGIARAAMEHGYSARFTTLAGMIGSVKATWGKRDGSLTEEQAIHGFASTDLLVLDEAGSMKCAGREADILFAILGARHNQCLPTVITANLLPDELGVYLGEQVVSRLREGGTETVPFNWDDYRTKLGKQLLEGGSVHRGGDTAICEPGRAGEPATTDRRIDL